MAVIVTKLDAPTNVQATLQDGGSLLANTTYYYRIVALYSLSPTLGLYGGINWSTPSIEISATTTSTKKSISLTWNAVAGASGYEVYKTTTSGDYSYTSTHRICHKTLSYLYAPTTTNSLIDDGTATLYNALFLENGYPLVTIDGGTEASPYTEEDIYNALINAGCSAHTSRISMVSDAGLQNSQYWFNCWILIQGWLRYSNGVSIMHEGTTSFANGNYGWLMGYKASTYTYGGAVYQRKFIYQVANNYPDNVMKFYNSYIKDFTSDYGGANLVLSNWYFVYSGKIYMRNCVYLHPALQLDGRAEGEIYDSTIRWSMNSSAKIATNNNFITRNSYPIYAYYATENTYVKNLKWDTTTYDMLFHKDFTPVNIDAINHTFKAEPPIGHSLTRPENVTVNRKYELFLKVIDKYGNPIENAIIEIQDISGNTITPEVSTSTGDVWVTSGTLSSSTSLILTDNTKNWEENTLTDYILEIYDGLGQGQEASIKSNTSNTITLKGALLITPNSTSKYRITMLMTTHSYKGKAAAPYYDTSSYTPLTLKIEKEGYDTYLSTFTPTQKLIETITLEDYLPPVYYQDSLLGEVESDIIDADVSSENISGNVTESDVSGIIN